ncbi:ScbR family autoregulator-binding transcription factor [Streptomyces sp. NBC_01506]|uniref:ScbR family autoregulator-binding transcription factor n=1 Tax=Streptomyces sp. NBC_01506 TaxID=2903887 RepID=UPI00386FB3C5
MATQHRAIRTRRTILTAAAKVFEQRGYQAATINEILTTAGVTKGALYFHFPSKEHLAEGVIHEQDHQPTTPDHPCKTQQIIDTILLHAYRLQTDPLVRAGVRLTLDPHNHQLNRQAPFQRWTQLGTTLLTQAHNQGELLPHIKPTQTAETLVGAFAGIQAMSQTLTNYQDLPQRTTTLLQHILPNTATPTTLTTLDLTHTRTTTLHTTLTTTQETSLT